MSRFRGTAAPSRRASSARRDYCYDGIWWISHGHARRRGGCSRGHADDLPARPRGPSSARSPRSATCSRSASRIIRRSKPPWKPSPFSRTISRRGRRARELRQARSLWPPFSAPGGLAPGLDAAEEALIVRLLSYCTTLTAASSSSWRRPARISCRTRQPGRPGDHRAGMYRPMPSPGRADRRDVAAPGRPYILHICGDARSSSRYDRHGADGLELDQKTDILSPLLMKHRRPLSAT